MTGALETLFFAVDSDTIQSEKCSTIFINAFYHRSLDGFDKVGLFLQQHFRPQAEILEQCGYEVHDSYASEQGGAYDLALVMVPKNIVEARYMIAQGLDALREGGTLICAADNKAGGGRLKKILQGFGLEALAVHSRHKAKALSVRKSEALDKVAVARALEEGLVQSVLGGEFMSQPGVFGWNKIDVGSRILAEHLPKDLKGRGADFGCGYGFLSKALLDKVEKVKVLTCIDADKRALEACKQNLKGYEVDIEYQWLDLTKSESALKNLDFIVMNPPFHEGKITDSSIGVAFIARAYESLRKGGRLWMVANKHLAYEKALEARFFKVEKLYEGQGFKVFEALV